MLDASSSTADPGSLNEAVLRSELGKLSRQDLAVLEMKLKWRHIARPKQLAPDDPQSWFAEKYGQTFPDWQSWLLRSGRGFGKTATGSNWIAPNACDNPGTFTHVVAPTRDDVRYTCFEGETGLLTYLDDCLITDYNKSDLIIYLWNGSVIRGFGSERPDKLRGPQCHFLWGEEVAAWSNAKETWAMAKFGHRLGKITRTVLTTTPKPVPLIKQLVAAIDNKKHFQVTGSTDENRRNLADSFYDDINKYRGTKLGRQEIEGELIDPEEDGIVTRSQFRMWPANKPLPHLIHIIMSLDTAFTEKTYDKKTQEQDPSGNLTLGLFEDSKRRLNVMILDAWDDYFGLPELIVKIREESKKRYGVIDRPLVGQPLVPSAHIERPVLTGTPISQLLVEDKGSGISLRQMLAMENILLLPYNPGKADKLARLHEVTPMFAHGRVWGVESGKRPGEFKNWMDKAISQICSYHGPGTTDHDEYVDCMSQGLKYFMRRFIMTFVEESMEQKIERREKAENEQIEALHTSHPYG